MRVAALVAFTLASPTLAEAPCPVTYPAFHAAIAHVDLPACPRALEGPHRFCRMVENEKGQHVFVFTVQGAQCLLETRRFDPGTIEPLTLAAAG